MSNRPLVFVVGTGRTGSTVLSRVLNRHPEVLSLNEYLVSLGGHAAFPGGTLSGARFWQLLADPHPGFNAMLRSGVSLPEFRYPGTGGRFTAATGIPAISLMVLPHLTEDPDALFDRLARGVPRWPDRSAAAHHRALFDELAETFGRRVVVERSGHSLDWVPLLHRAFPDARFVHMHRGGPDCALSMSRHGGYRAAALATLVLEHAGVQRFPELTPEHLAALPEDLARLCIDGFEHAFKLERSIPVDVFGRIWSTMVARGVPALRELPAGHVLTLRYEHLLESPEEALLPLAEHIGVSADRVWFAQAREELDPSRVGQAATELTGAEYLALREACAPGNRLLAAG